MLFNNFLWLYYASIDFLICCYYDFTMSFFGFYYAFNLIVYCFMIFVWISYDFHMITLCVSYEFFWFYYAFILISFMILNMFNKILKGLYWHCIMILFKCSYEFTRRLLWLSLDFTMRLIWFSYECLMDFLLCSHDFRMN